MAPFGQDQINQNLQENSRLIATLTLGTDEITQPERLLKVKDQVR
jgi:hypothetical protein